MAPVRMLSALAAVAALSGANAVVYNYNLGGQDWNVAHTTSLTGGTTGPVLAPAAPLCASSVSQSPINVPTTVATYNSTLKPLNVTYGSSSSWLMEVQANYLEVANIDTNTTTGTGAAGYTANAFTDGLTLPDGTFLPLNQFHFHTPSEHTINGMHYPLEMHMVHKLFRTNTSNATNPVLTASSTPGATLQRAAVIGIMFAYDPVGNNGTFMTALSNVFGNMSALGADSSDDFAVSDLPSQFSLQSQVFGVVGNKNYFTYTGSLTTPGCNEGITWFLMQNPMYASPLQVLQFTRMLAVEQNTMGRGSNNRLVQPLNNRPIYSSVPLS